MERVGALSRQLTATIHALRKIWRSPETGCHPAAEVGRLLFNGFPTGVEVCPAMHHGGPFFLPHGPDTSVVQPP